MWRKFSHSECLCWPRIKAKAPLSSYMHTRSEASNKIYGNKPQAHTYLQAVSQHDALHALFVGASC